MFVKRIFTLSLVFCFSSLTARSITYLCAMPRSAMVECLRMIGERGDKRVMHIPANHAYCHVHNYLDVTKGWYREDAPKTYKQALEDIYKEAETADVFVGENTHTAKDFLTENKEFIKDQRVQFIILLSNPHTAIISYYEKKKDIFEKVIEQTPTQMTDSVGLKGTYELVKEIEAVQGKKPLVIQSEDLYFKTKETVQAMCDYMQVPFVESALRWKDVSEGFIKFKDWYAIELTDCAKHWHMGAIKSTQFTKPMQYATDKNGNPTFEEIANEKHREICKKAYEENLVYYRLLLNVNPAHGKVTDEAPKKCIKNTW